MHSLFISLAVVGSMLVNGVVFAFSYPTQQDHIIEGVVVDQKGDPISAAVITVSGANLTATTSTDDTGRFQLKSSPQSSLTVEITAEGFEPIKQKVDPQAANSSQLRFVLAPAPVRGQVTVTATRTETRIEDAAASVIVLGENDLEATAALTLDDSLRQVPGFSLFRRSGSRTANPTTQGVSLRGLGASGASRAIVLADGLPLNDPFGAWVYWDRVPRVSIAEVEVLSGPASHLYGSGALGGVVNVVTKAREANSALLEMSYGNESTPNASLFATGRKDDWGASVAAEIFKTDGYVLVAPGERGPIDTPAGGRHSLVTVTADRRFGPTQHVFGSMSFFGESRENGTPLQTNRTHIRQFSFGGEVSSLQRGSISARGYGGTQVYDQNFTAISANRTSEALTRLQRVPAQVEGFTGQWSSAEWHHQKFVAGYESQSVRGASDEIVFVNNRATSLVGAGGRQSTTGAYFEDLITIGPRLFLNAGVRLDHWRNYKALSSTTPLVGSTPGTVIEFPDRSETAFNPQLSGVYKINSHVSLLFSVARAFRAPTLNELYRSFRVGNVLTLANENLLAERLTGGEGGARFSTLRDRVVIRGSGFWNVVTRPVANVTLQSTPTLITRQRQNLGRTRSSGLELDADARLKRFWTVSAGYLLADAVVVEFPANRGLEGLKIPQIPKHQFTFQLQYANPSLVTVGIQGRASSSQFDDDQNMFRLESYFVLDALVSRRISSRFDVFAAAENLFNQRYEVGKTPVTTIGPPILVRAGLRVRLGEK
jgi:outer membrane receptor protein involved in Fe transport